MGQSLDPEPGACERGSECRGIVGTPRRHALGGGRERRSSAGGALRQRRPRDAARRGSTPRRSRARAGARRWRPRARTRRPRREALVAAPRECPPREPALWRARPPRPRCRLRLPRRSSPRRRGAGERRPCRSPRRARVLPAGVESRQARPPSSTSRGTRSCPSRWPGCDGSSPPGPPERAASSRTCSSDRRFRARAQPLLVWLGRSGLPLRGALPDNSCVGSLEPAPPACSSVARAAADVRHRRRARRGPVDRALVEQMRDRLVHRGPDAAGLWSSGDGRVCSGIGGSRSSTRARGQPAVPLRGRPSGVVLNGEIYNFRALRAELEGRARVPHPSDTEVLLEAFRAGARTVCSSASPGCSRSPSGTSRERRCSARATARARSRSTTRDERSVRVRLRAQGAASWPRFRGRSTGGARRLPDPRLHPRSEDRLGGREEAPAGALARGRPPRDGRASRRRPRSSWDLDLAPDRAVVDWEEPIRDARVARPPRRPSPTSRSEPSSAEASTPRR